MKRLYILLCVISLSAVCGQTVCSQIIYRANQLDIEIDSSKTKPGYLNIGIPNGLFAQGSTDNQCFKIHIPETSLSSPCIGKNTISFYYEAYGMKQTIHFREAFILSDAKYKRNIKTLTSVSDRFFSSEDVMNLKSGNRIIDKENVKEKEYLWLKENFPSTVSIVDNDTLIDNAQVVSLLFAVYQDLSDKAEIQAEKINDLKQQVYSLGKTADNSAEILSCSPNPAISSINVKYLIPEDSKKYNLELFDKNGYKIKLIKADAYTDNADMDISGMEKGVGYVVLTADGKVVDVVRIIKL